MNSKIVMLIGFIFLGLLSLSGCEDSVVSTFSIQMEPPIPEVHPTSTVIENNGEAVPVEKNWFGYQLKFSNGSGTERIILTEVKVSYQIGDSNFSEPTSLEAIDDTVEGIFLNIDACISVEVCAKNKLEHDIANAESQFRFLSSMAADSTYPQNLNYVIRIDAVGYTAAQTDTNNTPFPSKSVEKSFFFSTRAKED